MSLEIEPESSGHTVRCHGLNVGRAILRQVKFCLNKKGSKQISAMICMPKY